MLGKMLAHGLVAAIIVGSGAAVYAQAAGEAQAPSSLPTSSGDVSATTNGYLLPSVLPARDHDADHKRRHDNDDDDN